MLGDEEGVVPYEEEKVEPEGFKPSIPPIIRTVIYAAGLIWGFLSTIAVGSVAVFWPDHAKDILAVMGSISGGFSFLAGATGVAYRPTSVHPVR